MSAPGPVPGAPPATCQFGHPLVWLLSPGLEHAGGEGLAACACTRRRLDGREFKGSQPVLWRWSPARPQGRGRCSPAALRPQFVSQNRVAFALALRLLDLLDETGVLTTDVADLSRQAEHVARLAARVKDLAPHIMQQPATSSRKPAGGPMEG